MLAPTGLPPTLLLKRCRSNARGVAGSCRNPSNHCKSSADQPESYGFDKRENQRYGTSRHRPEDHPRNPRLKNSFGRAQAHADLHDGQGSATVALVVPELFRHQVVNPSKRRTALPAFDDSSIIAWRLRFAAPIPRVGPFLPSCGRPWRVRVWRSCERRAKGKHRPCRGVFRSACR